ncbi:MAG: cell division protein MraZ [Frankiales bacterium]|nr:cell division protein MraZ [Frankiales bacterium]
MQSVEQGDRGVFLGTHTPRLDEKGRLFLPARFRDELAGGVVLTKGQDRCLFVYTADEFARRAEAVQRASQATRAARDAARTFFSSAFDQQPDKQGRITVPAGLRTYAGLDRDCVVVGAGNRLEVWDLGAWEAEEGSREDAFADLSEEVLPGLL